MVLIERFRRVIDERLTRMIQPLAGKALTGQDWQLLSRERREFLPRQRRHFELEPFLTGEGWHLCLHSRKGRQGWHIEFGSARGRSSVGKHRIGRRILLPTLLLLLQLLLLSLHLGPDLTSVLDDGVLREGQREGYRSSSRRNHPTHTKVRRNKGLLLILVHQLRIVVIKGHGDGTTRRLQICRRRLLKEFRPNGEMSRCCQRGRCQQLAHRILRNRIEVKSRPGELGHRRGGLGRRVVIGLGIVLERDRRGNSGNLRQS